MTTIKEIIDFLDKDLLKNGQFLIRSERSILSGIEDIENIKKISIKRVLISAVLSTYTLTKAIKLKANLIITPSSLFIRDTEKVNILFRELLRRIKLMAIGRITIYRLNKRWFHSSYGANYMLASKISNAKVYNKDLRYNKGYTIFTFIDFDPPISVKGLVNEFAINLGGKQISVFGDIKKKISKGIIVAGSFKRNKLYKIDSLMRKEKIGIDALITGEISYSTALHLIDNNLVIIEIGLIESLLPALNYLKNILQIKFKDVQFIVDNENLKSTVVFY
ncbi:MAG: Nif3-like dinuclear metal center hexameric protein [Candidatus Asgardarchaeia archaeon]